MSIPATPTTSGSGRLLEQRIQRLLDLRTDTPAVLESLGAISQAIDARSSADPAILADGVENTMDTDAIKRKLRSAVDWHSLEIANNFIKQMTPLAASFDALMHDVSTIQNSIATAAHRIEQSESSTLSFAAEAQELLHKRESVRAELEETKTFLHSYQIPSHYIDLLAEGPENGEGPEAFFAALEAAAACRQRAVELITGPNHALGLELLDAASAQLSSGMDSLFAYVQRMCRDSQHFSQAPPSQEGDEARHISKRMNNAHLLHKGLQTLRNGRRNLFKACQETAVATMKATIVRKFLRALTGTGGGIVSVDEETAQRPIDASAHDPLRYVGDMCAWVHYNVAELTEVFAAFFFREVQGAQVFQSDNGGDADVIMPLVEMVGGASEGIARPLTVRIEQIVASQASIVVMCKLLDTTGFYSSTLAPLLPSQAAVIQAVRKGTQTADKRMSTLTEQYGNRLRSSPQVFPADLSASPLVQSATSEIDQLCATFETSLSVSSADDFGLRPQHFQNALDTMLSALIENCRHASEGLRLNETATFMLNSLSALQTCIQGHVSTGEWVRRLESEMQTWEDSLTEQTTNDLLTSCGLLQKLAAMKAVPAGTPYASVKECRDEELANVAALFYNTLASPTLVTLYDRINSMATRSRLRTRTLAVLSQAYSKLYATVFDASQGYTETTRNAFSKPPAQIELLLETV